MAYEIEIELDSFASKEISIVLGADENKIDCKNIAYKYQKISNCKQELVSTKKYWKDLLRYNSSLYAIRIFKYYAKWLGNLPNNCK